jgi:outer membrane biosynthesis protein TonB
LLAKRVFLAFDTGRGLVYAPASGWQRAYLLWTFRNFRSLPQKVLNPRQQELIATLYRTACLKSAHELDGAVIGTIEGTYQPVPLPAPVTAGQLVSGGCADRAEPFYSRFAFSRTRLKAGAGALVVMVAAVAWHQLRPQAVSAAWTDTPAAAQRPSNEPSPKAVSLPTVPSSINLNAEPLPATQVASADQIATTVLRPVSTQGLTASPSPKGSPVFKQREPKGSAVGKRLVVAKRPAMHEASTELPRMRISGPPRTLVYPVCPVTSVRGKVSLHAVVGYDGAVSHVKVLRGNRVLAAAAIDAVRQWRYQPFSGDAPRLERETNITVSFVSSEVVAVSFPDSAAVSR